MPHACTPTIHTCVFRDVRSEQHKLLRCAVQVLRCKVAVLSNPSAQSGSRLVVQWLRRVLLLQRCNCCPWRRLMLQMRRQLRSVQRVACCVACLLPRGRHRLLRFHTATVVWQQRHMVSNMQCEGGGGSSSFRRSV